VNRALWHTGWRYLWRHRGASLLMILGIALGVAVMVAIDVANTSASRAFDLSVDAVAGRATHQVIGGPRGLDESVYRHLRVEGGIRDAAPVVTDYLVSPQLGNRPIQLLGVDPFAEAPFRSYLMGGSSGSSVARAVAGPGGVAAGGAGSLPVEQLVTWLTRPGALLISEDLAAQYGLHVGQTITVTVGGRQANALISGLLYPGDTLARRALDGLVLADIATAQELTGRLGHLDYIDLILAGDQSAAFGPGQQGAAGGLASPEQIRRLLPPDAQLVQAGARSGALAQMTAAFRTNLTALSLLALLVGMFLIYNSMTFSVVQRRTLFGTLRCLGATTGEIGALVLGEAALLGLIGSVLGLALGVVWGQMAVHLVTQTINDLYFVINVTGVSVPISSLLKGVVLGILATIAAAALPAYEAARIPPRLALSRAGLEERARRAVPLTGLAGMVALFTGLVILAIPTRSLVVSFIGVFLLTIGFAFLAPVVTVAFLRVAGPAATRVFGVLGRLAPRSVITTLSRTAVAIAALMVAVSVTIGVGLMVDSFRATVVTWLGQTLQADVYISAPTLTQNRTSIAIDPRVVATASHWPGVAATQLLRSVNVLSPAGPIAVSAVSPADFARRRLFVSAPGGAEAVSAAVKAGAVIVSEPLANRLNLPARGASVTLDTDQGSHSFPVAGVFRDYSSNQGLLMMSADTYHTYWADPDWTAAALNLAPGVSADQVAQDLAARLSQYQAVTVRPNSALRADVMQVFDRTFAITGALQLLAAIVAFIGVLSALLSLQLERARELGLLRAIGLTVGQLRSVILLETGLMGAAAGILAMPTGLALALVLVYIINRRSFGWTLQLQAQPGVFLQALLLAILAAVLAGIYPAIKLGRMWAAEALRSE
jgi:putative ABC transport system permease protein